MQNISPNRRFTAEELSNLTLIDKEKTREYAISLLDEMANKPVVQWASRTHYLLYILDKVGIGSHEDKLLALFRSLNPFAGIKASSKEEYLSALFKATESKLWQERLFILPRETSDRDDDGSNNYIDMMSAFYEVLGRHGKEKTKSYLLDVLLTTSSIRDMIYVSVGLKQENMLDVRMPGNEVVREKIVAQVNSADLPRLSFDIGWITSLYIPTEGPQIKEDKVYGYRQYGWAFLLAARYGGWGDNQKFEYKAAADVKDANLEPIMFEILASVGGRRMLDALRHNIRVHEMYYAPRVSSDVHRILGSMENRLDTADVLKEKKRLIPALVLGLAANAEKREQRLKH